MNILNVIDKNLFLKKLYPNGLFNFYIGRIELNTFNPRWRELVARAYHTKSL
ncbi:hypothetical protein [Capnocytophaga sputigena]|uniref:hypothetical protein n=1 Tax=Capnocytophaga sputigena TaxID=1019 RepID=UPI0028E763F6|nr:hypothetical protein [Capnocytophaga sputigena]